MQKNAYLSLNFEGQFSQIDNWQEQYFSRDWQRNSEPYNLYTYCLGDFTTKSLSLGFGWSPEVADHTVDAASNIFLDNDLLIDINEESDNADQLAKIASISVERGLKLLKNTHNPVDNSPLPGYWAGLPWFHQVWSRDELITGLGLDAPEQKNMILRYLQSETVEGELPTYIGSGTYCADGLGWLCLLTREFGIRNFNQDEKTLLIKFLSDAESGLSNCRIREEGLVFSGNNATWMDTIGRDGFRVEIQFMYALLLELLYELTGNKDYSNSRQQFKELVKKIYFKDSLIFDGYLDDTIRPNIFVCYLLQPDLLTGEQWKTCFQNTLTKCETDWGGLSSIDKNNPKFVGLTTGQNNVSYHNGDSWFFINNLAAIAMYRLDADTFADPVRSLLESGTYEILWKHKIGYPGEISSAEKFESFGCGLQGFSGGTYLMLLKEMKIIY